jgi:hypothetical protein
MNILNTVSKRSIAILYVLIFCTIGLLSLNLPFFWDQLLNSRIAVWLFDTNFSSLILPKSLDFGHPPFFGFYIALFWKVLGKSLISSHMAMIPILMGIAWQYFKLTSRFFTGKFLILSLLLLLAEPTILAQCTMVSSDVAMLFFYLLAVNSILDRKKIFLIISLIVLPLLNIRGVSFSISLFCFDIILAIVSLKEYHFKIKYFLIFMISGMVALTWYVFHYYKTGWMFFMPSSIYESARRVDNLSGILRNLVVIWFCFLEYGRILMWGFICFVLITNVSKFKEFAQNIEFKSIVSIFITPFIIFTVFVSLINNYIGPRYFLVIYLNLILLFVYFLKTYNLSKIKKYIVASIVFLGLITGHLWVYPEKIANGWDCTLAHVPYFKLREQMNDYIVKSKIPIDSISSRFPISYDYRFANLSDSTLEFHYSNVQTDKYILYSNIINDFTDEEIDQLKQYKIVKEYSKSRIYIILYQRQ